MSECLKYLQPNDHIDSDHPAIQEQVRKLTRNMKEQVEKAVALFNYVRDDITYNMYACQPGAAFKASAVLQNGEGWCLQKSLLLAALGRAAGIPSRLVIATIRNYQVSPEVIEFMGGNLFFPHAYNQFYLEGKWVKAAAALDSELCKRIEVPVVEFDGRNDAMMPALALDGQPFIEYIEDFGYFADIPFALIQDKCKQIYGPELAGYMVDS